MILDIWRDWQKPIFRYRRPQYALLIPCLALLLMGVLIQFVLGPALVASQVTEVSVNHLFWRHLITALLGLGALYLGFKIKLQNWFKYSVWILAGGLILSLLAIVVGTEADVRWLQIGSFSLQPVEILKVGFILLAAGYFYQTHNAKHQSWWEMFKANRVTLIILAVLGLVVLVWQRDYGSMFVLGMIFLAMFWVSGAARKFVTTSLLVMAVLGTLFIVIAPYRLERLSVFLNPTADCQDSGYQVCQALIGVGSGGLLGRGFDSSVQIYGYLPEANNDTVFAGYAELVGFVGSVVMVGLLIYLFYLLYKIARRLEDSLMLVVIGCLTWLGVQAMVNIGGILNLLPLKGITLPLISAGGSSLIFVLLMLGIVLQISGYTIGDHESTSYQGGTRRRRHRRTRHAARGSGRTR